MSLDKIVTLLLVAVLVGVLFLAWQGLFASGKAASRINTVQLARGANRDTLFVLIHGLDGGPSTWKTVAPSLEPYGDVVALYYDASRTSNVDPAEIAVVASEEIQKHFSAGNYAKVVLVGYSAGSLIARRAYLTAAGARAATTKRGGEDSWATRTSRIVLLAGMNRGWDISGQKPLDMSLLKQLLYRVGSWYGRLTNQGRFILGTETGVPFVSNLRLDWMQWVRQHPDTTPETVQLLGDIDDVVSDEDSKDLRAAAGARYFYLRVRGTRHNDIIDFADTSDRTGTYAGIGPYRQQKFILAATGTAAEILAQAEEQGYQTDGTVKHVVFVLHGIRDLGEWSASFEEQLLSMDPRAPDSRLVVVSVRYGYFSMASFLFRPDRQKFVRWFMDRYTETLARYPNVGGNIDFIGHSNGTYLLASALSQYSSLKIRRAVFAGSVVRQDYDWSTRVARGQVQAMRNYVATEDWVVALFPRFFEPAATRWLGNDVGSAGFRGFRSLPAGDFENVTIRGGHSAFLNQVPQIAEFVTTSDLKVGAQTSAPPEPTGRQKVVGGLLSFHAEYLFWFVWLAMIVILGIPAIRMAVAGGQYAWVPVLIYAGLVSVVLNRL